MALTDNIIGYYKLDGNSNDSVNGRNGTDTSITYSAANGKINQGAGFDGSLSKIDLGATNAYNAASAIAFSFSCWVNINANTWVNSVTIIADDSTTNPPLNNGFYVALDNRGGVQSPLKGVQFVAQGVTAPCELKSNDNVLSANGWHFVVCTYTASTGKIYVDNVDVTNIWGTPNGNYVPRNAHIFFGAANDSTLKMNAALDEVGMWSRALSSAEVSQLWNSGAGLQYPFSSTSANRSLILSLIGVG